MQEVDFRSAVASDAAAVAGLHADSWRRHYRGAYTDEFLDNDVLSDRRQVWGDRLSAAAADRDRATFVAGMGTELVGFAHVVLDMDPNWGALLDNLHVASGHQRRGIGAQLMVRAAGFVQEERPSSGLYLWVLEQNVKAQRFYQAIGGEPADSEPVRPVNGVPGRLNGSPIAIRYVWPDPSTITTR